VLTPTKSRPHHSAGRTVFVALLALAVVATLVGVGYLLTRHSGPARHAAATTPATSLATTTTAAAPSSTPATSAPSQLPAGVVPFVALPVGTPPTPGASESRYPWHQLKASLQGPRTLSSGSTVTYTVVLRNPTAAAVSLEPCPSYDIDVGLHTSSYGLNCAAAPSSTISPGASVSFEVQLYIPSSIGAGSSTVSWTLGWSSDRGSPHAQLKVDVQ
jgi:hypothetical protein